MSQVSAGLGVYLASWIGASVEQVQAEEAIRSLEKCSTTSKNPCVSTSNVRQLDMYMPPWTFDVSEAEAMSRLKGAIKADPACEIVTQEGNSYLKVQASRSEIFGTIDELEFVINGRDQVITFRSAANSDGSYFGAN